MFIYYIRAGHKRSNALINLPAEQPMSADIYTGAADPALIREKARCSGAFFLFGIWNDRGLIFFLRCDSLGWPGD